MSKIASMMAAAKQRGDFETVCEHYGCSAEEISEMKAIANANRAEARECFAYLAGQIRSKSAT
jgi:hypothetical protein